MLTYSLDNGLPMPLYEQLYRYLRTDIENGMLGANEKLPSKRTLCAHLKISQNTVETAYAQLIAEGYLYTKPKSGYFVQAMEPRLPARKVTTAAPTTTESTAAEPGEVPPRYDFKTNEVDTDHFPFSIWAKLTREILCENSRDLLRSVHPQGEEGLRAEIAHYLRTFRGIQASPEQIIVGAGSEYLLSLVIQLLGRERGYAVENPGYPKIQRIFRSNGAKTQAVDLDENGVRLDALRQSGAAIVHVTPSHHFPLGIIMPVARRLQLLQWAEEQEGRYILEDDYDSEFRFSGRPIPALQGLDRSGRVIYFNTFAKSLAPSLRIGYMVLPEPLLKVYQRDFLFYSSTVPSFEQHTLRRFLQDGYFERHLSRMRGLYKVRRDILLAELASRDPQRHITVFGQDTGVHLVLHVHNGMTEAEMVESARAAGVKVYGLSDYYSDKSSAIGNRIVLGYAGFPPADMAEAVELLAQAWQL